MNDRTPIEHPSFGMISIHRIQGNSGFMYGSNIRAENYIEIEIHKSDVTRDVSNDWYHEGDELISVKLTPVQFSELLTTHNGTGVPCTITAIDGKAVEQCNFMKDKKTIFAEEFKQKVRKNSEKMVNALNSIREILKTKKYFTKAEAEELERSLAGVVQDYRSNIPWEITQFQEEMDKVVVDAKAEIEAAISNTIVAAGIEALGEKFQSKLLGNKE